MKDKFDPVFVERRRQALEAFLEHLLAHPELGQSPVTKEFVSQQSFLQLRQPNISSTSVLAAANGIASILDQVGEAVSGLVFGKSGPVEERFERMRTACRTLEDRLGGLEEALQRLYKAQRALEEGQQQAARDAPKLAAGLPPEQSGLRKALARMALASQDQSGQQHDFVMALKAQVIIPTHQWAKYVGAAREALKVRDERQGDCEALGAYLSRCRAQQAELRGLPSDAEGQASTSLMAPIKQGARAVSNYVSDRLDRLKGLDVLTAKQQKLGALERRIGELEAAIRVARDASNQADDLVEREMEHFEGLLQAELRAKLLPALRDLHLNLAQRSATTWATTISA